MNNDLISREAALEIVMKYCPDDDGSCSSANVDLREMLDEIEAIPAVDAEPVRHAMWIQTENVLGEEIDVCSWCKEKAVGYDTLSGGYMTEPTDYCPHCGAKMDGGNEE